MIDKVTKKLSDAKTKLTGMPTVEKTWTKAEITAYIADKTGLTRNKVAEVFETELDLIQAHLKNSVTYVRAGLLKLNVVEKAATPARSTTNPFTKQPMQIQAKPAYKTVRVKALKKLKNMASDIEVSGHGADLA